MRQALLGKISVVVVVEEIVVGMMVEEEEEEVAIVVIEVIEMVTGEPIVLIVHNLGAN